MIKYATAIPQGTASTEVVPRRLTRTPSTPTYQAMLEGGRAQRTILMANCRRGWRLQREITEGLNVVEACNGTTRSSATARAPRSPPAVPCQWPRNLTRT